MSNSQQDIRLVLAEDHTLLRQSMRQLLTSHNADFSILAEAGNGRELVDAVRKHQPDVVLVDVNMPVMNGIEATRAIKATEAVCKIIILTGYEDPNLFELAMDAGAYGLLFMDSFSTKSDVTSLSGRGMGLAAVKAEIEALGGSMKITSKPGQGSEFAFRIPVPEG